MEERNPWENHNFAQAWHLYQLIFFMTNPSSTWYYKLVIGNCATFDTDLHFLVITDHFPLSAAPKNHYYSSYICKASLTCANLLFSSSVWEREGLDVRDRSDNWRGIVLIKLSPSLIHGTNRPQNYWTSQPGPNLVIIPKHLCWFCWLYDIMSFESEWHQYKEMRRGPPGASQIQNENRKWMISK